MDGDVQPGVADGVARGGEAPRVAELGEDRDRGQLAERIGGNRACLALARKLLKRSYHILKALGDQALQPLPS